MSLIVRMRKQKAVLWGNPVADGNGDWTFDQPVEIDCRWEDTQKLFTDKDGKLSVSQAKVYIDRDIVTGSYLMLGTLVMLPSDASNPKRINGTYEVRSFSKLPNLKATEFLRTATL